MHVTTTNRPHVRQIGANRATVLRTIPNRNGRRRFGDVRGNRRHLEANRRKEAENGAGQHRGANRLHETPIGHDRRSAAPRALKRTGAHQRATGQTTDHETKHAAEPQTKRATEREIEPQAKLSDRHVAGQPANHAIGQAAAKHAGGRPSTRRAIGRADAHRIKARRRCLPPYRPNRIPASSSSQLPRSWSSASYWASGSS